MRKYYMKGCETMDNETREMLTSILNEIKGVKADVQELEHIKGTTETVVPFISLNQYCCLCNTKPL